jgi:hypothetical protein
MVACACKAVPPLELSTDENTSVQIHKEWVRGVLVVDREILSQDFHLSLSLAGVALDNGYHPPCYEVAVELRCDAGNPTELESRWPLPGPMSHLAVPAWCPGVGSTFLYNAFVTAQETGAQDDGEEEATLRRPASCHGREGIRVLLRALPDFREEPAPGSEYARLAAQPLELTDWCTVP